ncbi:hypothetical protein T484DRAFT_1822595, partial [Baffinella frigidus]
AHVGDVGVIADVTECEFLPDGRANLKARCRERYRILETWVEDGTQGLHWCKVEIVHDEACPEGEQAALAALAAKCAAHFQEISSRCAPGDVAALNNMHGSCPLEPQAMSFWLCSVLPLPYGAKQALLTLRSTSGDEADRAPPPLPPSDAASSGQGHSMQSGGDGYAEDDGAGEAL